MSHQAFLAQLEEILELSPGTLQGSEALESMETWDSLAMMNFIAMVNDQYGLTLSPRQISTCKSVTDLMNLAHSKI
jgi:acyl carrier protein